MKELNNKTELQQINGGAIKWPTWKEVKEWLRSFAHSTAIGLWP